MTDLPGDLSPAALADDLRRHTGDPGLTVERVTVTPVAHAASAPTTAGLHRVVVTTGSGTVHRLVVKGLQAARHGLPPVIPAEDRAHLDRVIPWRLEVDLLGTPLVERMPAGLRAPEVVAVHEQDDDRATLWMVDVEPVETPWTPADTERSAELLGRLAARRREDPVPPFPGGDFLTAYAANQLDRWAVPRILAPDTWGHPLLAPHAGLRPALTALAGDLPTLRERIASTPHLPAHGDPTPMNLLRPRSAPQDLVAIDWGTSTTAPVGWDLVPLVFGRAEAGSGDPADLAVVLPGALDAHRAGLAAEGVDVGAAELTRSVLDAALLRYPLTSLPFGVLDGMPEDPGRTTRKAAFVAAVLALSGR